MQAAVKNVEEFLATKDDDNWKMPTKTETPLHTSYRPGLYVPLGLGPNEAAYCMSLMAMMRCMVEIGRVYIWIDFSMISSHLALPLESKLRT